MNHLLKRLVLPASAAMLLPISFFIAGCDLSGLIVKPEQQVGQKSSAKGSARLDITIGRGGQLKFPQGTFPQNIDIEHSSIEDVEELSKRLAEADVDIETDDKVNLLGAFHILLQSDAVELRMQKPMDVLLPQNNLPPGVVLPAFNNAEDTEAENIPAYLLKFQADEQDDTDPSSLLEANTEDGSTDVSDLNEENGEDTPIPSDEDQKNMPQIKALVVLVGPDGVVIGVPFVTTVYYAHSRLLAQIYPGQLHQGIIPSNSQLIISFFLVKPGATFLVDDKPIEDLPGNTDNRINHDPFVENPEPQVVVEGDRLDIVIVAEDEDNDTLTFTPVGTLPKWISLKHDTLKVVPDFDVVARGEDGKLPESSDFTVGIYVEDNGFPSKRVRVDVPISVKNLNQPPELVASDMPTECREGETIAYQFSATDPDGDKVFYALGDVPFETPLMDLVTGKPQLDSEGNPIKVPVVSIDPFTGDLTFYCDHDLVAGYKQFSEIPLEIIAGDQSGDAAQLAKGGTVIRKVIRVQNVNRAPTFIVSVGDDHADLKAQWDEGGKFFAKEGQVLEFTVAVDDLDGDQIDARSRRFRVSPNWPSHCVNDDFEMNIGSDAEDLFAADAFDSILNGGEPLVDYNQRNGQLRMFLPHCLVDASRSRSTFKFDMEFEAEDDKGMAAETFVVPVSVENVYVPPLLSTEFREEHLVYEGASFVQDNSPNGEFKKPCPTGKCGFELSLGDIVLDPEQGGYDVELVSLQLVGSDNDGAEIVVQDVTASERDRVSFDMPQGNFGPNNNVFQDRLVHWRIPFSTVTLAGDTKTFRMNLRAKSKTAKDAQLDFSFKIVVGNTNIAPVFSGGGGANTPQVAEGVEASVDLSQFFSDPDGDTLLFRFDRVEIGSNINMGASGGPGGGGFVSTSNMFTQQPAIIDGRLVFKTQYFLVGYNQTGTLRFFITAKDSSGSSSSDGQNQGNNGQEVVVQINNTVEAPRLSDKYNNAKSITVYEHGDAPQNDFNWCNNQTNNGPAPFNRCEHRNGTDGLSINLHDLVTYERQAGATFEVLSLATDNSSITIPDGSYRIEQFSEFENATFLWNLPQALVGPSAGFGGVPFSATFRVTNDAGSLDFSVNIGVKNSNRDPQFIGFNPNFQKPQVREGDDSSVDLSKYFSDLDGDTLTYRLDWFTLDYNRFLSPPVLDGSTLTFKPNYDVSFQGFGPFGNGDNDVCFRIAASDGVTELPFNDACVKVKNVIRKVALKKTKLTLTAYEDGYWDQRCAFSTDLFCGNIFLGFYDMITNQDNDGLVITAVDTTADGPMASSLLKSDWGGYNFNWSPIPRSTVNKTGGTFTFTYKVAQLSSEYAGQTQDLTVEVTVKNVNQDPFSNAWAGNIEISEKDAVAIDLTKDKFKSVTTNSVTKLVKCLPTDTSTSCKPLIDDPDGANTLTVALDDTQSYGDESYYDVAPSISGTTLSFTPSYEVSGTGWNNSLGIPVKGKDDEQREVQAWIYFTVVQVNRPIVVSSTYDATKEITAYEEFAFGCVQNCGSVYREVMGGQNAIFSNADGLPIVINSCDKLNDPNCKGLKLSDYLTMSTSDPYYEARDVDLLSFSGGTWVDFYWGGKPEFSWQKPYISTKTVTSAESPKTFTFPLSVASGVSGVSAASTTLKIKVYNAPQPPTQNSYAQSDNIADPAGYVQGDGKYYILNEGDTLGYDLKEHVVDDESGALTFKLKSIDSSYVNDSIKAGKTTYDISGDGLVTFKPGPDVVPAGWTDHWFWAVYSVTDNTNLSSEIWVQYKVINVPVDTTAITDAITDLVAQNVEYRKDPFKLFKDPDGKICHFTWGDPDGVFSGSGPGATFYGDFIGTVAGSSPTGEHTLTITAKFAKNGESCGGAFTGSVGYALKLNVSDNNLPPVVNQGYASSNYWCWWDTDHMNCERLAMPYEDPLAELGTRTVSLSSLFVDANQDNLTYSCDSAFTDPDPNDWRAYLSCSSGDVTITGSDLKIRPGLNAVTASEGIKYYCVRLKVTDDGTTNSQPDPKTSLDRAEICGYVSNRNMGPVIHLPHVLHVAQSEATILDLSTNIIEPEGEDTIVKLDASADGITLQQGGGATTSCTINAWYNTYQPCKLSVVLSNAVGSTVEVVVSAYDVKEWVFDSNANQWVSKPRTTVKRTIRVAVENQVALITSGVTHRDLSGSLSGGSLTGIAEVPYWSSGLRATPSTSFGTLVAFGSNGIYKVPNDASTAVSQISDDNDIRDVVFYTDASGDGKLLYATGDGYLVSITALGTSPGNNTLKEAYVDPDGMAIRSVHIGAGGSIFIAVDESADGSSVVEIEPKSGAVLGTLTFNAEIVLDLSSSAGGALFASTKSGNIYKLGLDSSFHLNATTPVVFATASASAGGAGDLAFNFGNKLLVLSDKLQDVSGDTDVVTPPGSVATKIGAADIPGSPVGLVVTKHPATAKGNAVYIANATGVITRYTYNRSPNFVAPTTLVYSVNEGETLSISLRTKDDNSTASASNITLGASGLPAFATFDQTADASVSGGMEARGTLKLSPTFSDSGEYTISLTATEIVSSGQTAQVSTKNLKITVVNVNEEPYFPEFGVLEVLTNSANNLGVLKNWDIIDPELDAFYDPWINQQCVGDTNCQNARGNAWIGWNGTSYDFHFDAFGVSGSSVDQTLEFGDYDQVYPTTTRTRQVQVDVIQALSATGFLRIDQITVGSIRTANRSTSKTNMTMYVSNSGSAAATVGTVTFHFRKYGTQTAATGFSVVEVNPTSFANVSIAAGSVQPFTFDVDIAADATLGYVTIDAEITGSDSNADYVYPGAAFAKGLMKVNP